MTSSVKWIKNILYQSLTTNLGVVAKKKTLLAQQPNKIVAHGWLEATWVQLLSQCEEWLWVALEEADLEYRLRIGQLILLQIVI